MSGGNASVLNDPSFIRIGDKMINVAYAKRIALVRGCLEVTVSGINEEVTHMLRNDAEAVFQKLQRFCLN